MDTIRDTELSTLDNCHFGKNGTKKKKHPYKLEKLFPFPKIRFDDEQIQHWKARLKRKEGWHVFEVKKQEELKLKIEKWNNNNKDWRVIGL